MRISLRARLQNAREGIVALGGTCAFNVELGYADVDISTARRHGEAVESQIVCIFRW